MNSSRIRETMSNRTTQINECLNKLYDLMPDGIITYEVIHLFNINHIESILVEIQKFLYLI